MFKTFINFIRRRKNKTPASPLPDSMKLPGDPPPHGYKFWAFFAAMGGVGWFFEAVGLWPWWSHADMASASSSIATPSTDPVFFNYVGHPAFSLFVGTIGLFQLIRVIMFTNHYYHQPDKSNLLELMIFWPGVISMNFAIACIIWGSFNKASLINAGLGFMVGAHAPAISLFFVAGAALIFLKKVFFDVGYSYYQIWRIKQKYPDAETRPDMAHATIESLREHIKFNGNFAPLWAAILFAVLVCFTLPAFTIAIPWWLATLGVLAIMSTTAWYAFKADIRDTWLQAKERSRLEQVPLVLGIVLLVAACFVLSVVATVFLPWWAALLIAIPLFATAGTLVFKADANPHTERSRIEQIHHWVGLGARLSGLTEEALDATDEYATIRTELALLEHENTLRDIEEDKSLFVRIVNRAFGPTTSRTTKAKEAIDRISTINKNPAGLMHSPTTTTPANPTLAPGNYNAIAFDALKKIAGIVRQAENGEHGLSMSSTLKTIKAWLRAELGDSLANAAPDPANTEGYYTLYNRIVELCHFKALRAPVRNKFKSTRNPYFDLYEAIAGHPASLENSTQSTLTNLGKIKASPSSTETTEGTATLTEYRAVTVKRYVESRIEILRKEHAKGMRRFSWYRFADPFASILDSLTERCIKTLHGRGIHLVLLNNENKPVNIPTDLGRDNEQDALPAISAKDSDAFKFLRRIAPGHTNQVAGNIATEKTLQAKIVAKQAGSRSGNDSKSLSGAFCNPTYVSSAGGVSEDSDNPFTTETPDFSTFQPRRDKGLGLFNTTAGAQENDEQIHYSPTYTTNPFGQYN